MGISGLGFSGIRPPITATYDYRAKRLDLDLDKDRKLDKDLQYDQAIFQSKISKDKD